ncbi:MAG TPA: relaxase/mobilization nuclease domain-containing protein [Thermoanaerobaculia bacterium]|nr:relaxase/mobilization nuclease domain-containing protein [Thermoanaerobaculia bacterium]
MIQKIPPKPKNPRRLLAYLLRPEKGHLLGGTLSSDAGVEEILAEIETYGALNRRVQRSVFHASLRLAPGETLTDEEWLAAVETYLHGMGFDDNAYVVARHTDGGSDHVHIVACRIRADGTCVSDSNDFARGERLVREIEARFGLQKVAPSHLTDARALSRGELAQALRNGVPSARLELQEMIEDAAQRSSQLTELVAALKAEGVGVLVHLDRDGAPRGLSFELDGVVMSGTSLGRGFTLRGLAKRFGLSWEGAPEHQAGEERSRPSGESPAEPEASGSATDLRPRLAGLVRQAAEESPDLAGFVKALEAQGVRVRFHLDAAGKPLGISYRLGPLGISGSNLGKELSLGGLARHHGLDVESPESRKLISQRGVASGRTTERGQGPAERRQGKGKGREKGKDDPAELERRKAELVALLHAAAAEGEGGAEAPRLPRFTAFGRAAEAKGVELRVFSHAGEEPLGIGYHYGGRYFRASSLGPELTLRGLNSYLSVAIDAQEDRAYLAEVTVEIPKTEYKPEDREELTRKVADSIAQAADSASGETRAFLAGLEEAGVSLRLYVSPDGSPRQVAYSFEGEFFTDKALGREYGLKGLAQYFDLAFDPEKDAELITSLVVRLGKDAVVDRETLAATLEARILAAAADHPSFSELHRRLGEEGIKLHVYSDGKPDGKRQGLSYELRGVRISASSLGPAYTLKGLESSLGVAIDPERDRALLDSLTTKVSSRPEGPDLREEVREAVSMAAQSSRDLGDFVRRLEETDVRVLFHLDEGGQVRGISYQLDGRSFSGGELGPAFTAHGLVSFFGLPVDSPAHAAVIEAHAIRPRAGTEGDSPAPPAHWTPEAATQLSQGLERLRMRGVGPELGRASAALRLDPVSALRTAAHAHYLWSAATHPTLAARMVLRMAPGGELADGALALFGAFRSPVAATFYALRLASRTLHGAGELARPRHPGDQLARQLLHTYAQAALSDAPSLEAYLARLEVGGIEVRLDPLAPSPRLVYRLGDEPVPADQLGPSFTLRALKARFGDTDEDLPALLREPAARAVRPGEAAGDPAEPAQQLGRPAGGPVADPGESVSRAAGISGRGASGAAGASPTESASASGADAPERVALRASPPSAGPAAELPAPGGAGDPHRAAAPLSPDGPAPTLAPAGGGAPDLRVGERAGRGLSPALPGPAERASRASLAETQATVRRQLEAFGVERFDLRVVGAPDRPLIFKRSLKSEEVVRSAPWLRALNRKGASVEIRPAGDGPLQLLRGVSEESLARAVERGFEPALTVRVEPGRYDVWLRHVAPGTEPPEEVLTYARRIARLEYGQSSPRGHSFGALAGFTTSPSSGEAALVSAREVPYRRAGDLIPYLAWHASETRAELGRACQRLGLPSLASFREQNPALTPRQADLGWARLALSKGLPQEQVLTLVALQGSRAQATHAPRAVAYGVKILSSALYSTLSQGGDAAAAATLHALGSAVSLPGTVLRLAWAGVTAARRLVAGR